MNTRKFLNGFLVFGLVVAVALFLGVASPAFADHNENPSATFDENTGDPDEEDARIEDRARLVQHTGDNKILISGLAAGQVMDQYIVEGSDSVTFSDMGTPNGNYAGSQTAPANGEALTWYAPVSGVTSNFFLWSEAGGWELWYSTSPSPSSTDTEL